MKQHLIYEKSFGLNTLAADNAKPYSARDGYLFTSVANNVEIDENATIRTSRGFFLLQPLLDERPQYLIERTDGLLYSSRGFLFFSDKDFSNRRRLAAGLSVDEEIFFVNAGGWTFYSDGTHAGVFDGTACGPWRQADVSKENSEKKFIEPPSGKYLTLCLGRIFLAKGKVLWFTEPQSFFLVDPSRGFVVFDEEIQGIVSMTDKLFVFLESRIEIFEKPGSSDMCRIIKIEESVLPGTICKISNEQIQTELLSKTPLDGNAVLFLSKNGVFFLDEKGMSKKVVNRWNVQDVFFGEASAVAIVENNFYKVLSREGKGFCLNLKSLGLSHLSQFYFFHAFVVEGSLCITRDEGVYRQTSGPDLTCSSEVTFPSSSLSSISKKSPRCLYVEATGEGTVVVDLITPGGSSQRYISVSENSAVYRIYFPRNRRSSNFSLSITAPVGSCFLLEKIKLAAIDVPTASGA